MPTILCSFKGWLVHFTIFQILRLLIWLFKGRCLYHITSRNVAKSTGHRAASCFHLHLLLHLHLHLLHLHHLHHLCLKSSKVVRLPGGSTNPVLLLKEAEWLSSQRYRAGRHFLNVWNSFLDSQQWLLSPSQSSTANQEMMTVKCLRWGGEWIFEDVEWMQCIRWEPWSEYLWMLKSTWGAPPSVETDRQDIWKSSSTSSLIGTEGALRLPTTYDKNPIPSNPIHPSNPHIALRTTSPLKIWSNQSNQYNWSNRPNQSNRSNRCTRQWLWRWRSVKDSIA